MLVQDFISGLACCVNWPHHNSSLSRLVVILVHTTGSTWYKVLCQHTLYVILLRELTTSQLVAIAIHDTGSHNKLDLIQSLVPTHYVCNGYTCVYCLQMLKVHEKSYCNLYFVFNCNLKICILEHTIVLCAILLDIYKKQLSLLSDLQESKILTMKNLIHYIDSRYIYTYIHG